MRDIENKARNTSRSSSFSAGRTIATPGNDQSAGGANLKKPFPTQSGGEALNKGRSGRASGTEVHHNGGTQSISMGSMQPPR